MNVFGIGLPEMVLIFLVALLIFGPKKLPEIGRSLGKTLKSFQEASKEFEAEIKKEVDKVSEPFEEGKPMEAKLMELEPPQLAEASPVKEMVEEQSTEHG